MQREPLAEQALGRESLADRAKMFDRVEKTRSVAPGMKQVRHNHIIPRAGRTNETAGISDEHVPGRRALRRKVEGRKLRHDLDHLRNEFDAVTVQAGIKAGRAESNARPQAEEQRAFRRGMQEQREVGLPILQRRRNSASHLKTVIDAQRAVPGRVLDHRD